MHEERDRDACIADHGGFETDSCVCMVDVTGRRCDAAVFAGASEYIHERIARGLGADRARGEGDVGEGHAGTDAAEGHGSVFRGLAVLPEGRSGDHDGGGGGDEPVHSL